MFSVAKLDDKNQKSSPTANNTSPVKKLWSELVEEDSDNDPSSDVVPLAAASGHVSSASVARARSSEEELQFSIEHLVSSSDARSATGGVVAGVSPPSCCDSTTVDALR